MTQPLKGAAETLRDVLEKTLADTSVANTSAKQQILASWYDLIDCIAEEKDLASGWRKAKQFMQSRIELEAVVKVEDPLLQTDNKLSLIHI